ncbi:MAG: hypothetical protein FJ304_15395 [Planctomycetes bacterium]|nr:hypothetical protein [Planctomycetota bacterium]
MSSAPTPPAPPPGSAPVPAAPAKREITLISHSMLFYWWPIWLLGFTMALITWMEDHRLAIVPAEVIVASTARADVTEYTIAVKKGQETKSLNSAVDQSKTPQNTRIFPTRVSAKAWMGPLFCVVLLLTVVITNVPLRGLWSFLVLLMMLILALSISLIPDGWDKLLGTLGNLHIYINMAGYLFIATVVFVLWAVSVFIFDQRTYIVVTPGQIQVCEHVGAAIRNYDTTGLVFEKQRDDLFRHWLLGFFSGDLIVKTSGAERETIRLPNVLWIGWRLEEVQALLREKSVVAGK